MYYGSTMSFLGAALVYGKPAGILPHPPGSCQCTWSRCASRTRSLRASTRSGTARRAAGKKVEGKKEL